MEDDMTDQQKDCGLPIADCGLTQTNDANPQSDIQNAESDDEAAVAPQSEEPDAVQGQTVPFEEDAVPPAQADATVQDDLVGCAPHTAPTETLEAGDAANSQSEIPNPPSAAPTVDSVIEAILFATDEPLTDSKLAAIVEASSKQVRQSVEALNARYEANNNAFRIEQIAGGYQMLTLNIYNGWLKKMLHARSDSKLSPAAMETLAIIAYKQPVIRADIEAIRGVAVGEVIRSLMYKGLVKIVGRAEVLGHPMLYGTTKKFLEVFGLNSLNDLPKAEELKNPDR
jgi:segregation and condensation protein B